MRFSVNPSALANLKPRKGQIWNKYERSKENGCALACYSHTHAAASIILRLKIIVIEYFRLQNKPICDGCHSALTNYC